MLIFKHIIDLQNHLLNQIKNSKTIGFVPTMGALHKGHLSLIEKAKQDNDISVCSIFVNPTQFNEKKDLKAYPRTIEKDILLLEEVGNSILFLPTEDEIYPDGSLPKIDFDFAGLDTYMEGSYRPGHFDGVVMVLHRFLDIIKPNSIYMGQKDYQQYLITKKLAKDFHPKTTVQMVLTARENDGLAMSSRNLRLGKEGRIAAKKLNIALKSFAEKIKSNDLNTAREDIIKELNNDPIIEVEYLEVANSENLTPLKSVNQTDKKVVCIAAKVEEVRLIDNLIIS